MKYRTNTAVRGCLWCAAALVALLGARAAWADDPAAPATKAAAEEKAVDPFLVPDGTPAELLKYIDRLGNARPSGNSEEEVKGFFKKQATALLAAAEKILAAKPDAKTAQTAGHFKIIALRMFGELGDASAQAKLAAFQTEAEKAGLKGVAREVCLSLLAMRADNAENLSKTQFATLVDDVKQAIGQGELDEMGVELAKSIAMTAEGSDPELAIKAYDELGKILAASPDRAIAGAGATMEGAARRLGLVGKKFVLEGSTVAGKPVDWKAYKGKVVLIDFFATWCGPCRAEMPNIAKNYKLYHKRGFDVVSISVDQDRKALEDFLEQEKHPWTVVLDNSEARGTAKSMSTYYGIFGIPQMILVGKDGNVVALNVRGPELGKALEKLLGPADEKTPAVKTTSLDR